MTNRTTAETTESQPLDVRLMEAMRDAAAPTPTAALMQELNELDLPETVKTRLAAQLRAEPAETPEASPAAPSTDPSNSPSDEPSAPSPPDATQDLAAQLAALREELQKAEARYSTLRGKYDAETAALRAALAQLQAPRTEPPASPAATPSRETPPSSDRELIRQQLRERYGQTFEDDVIDLVSAAAELAERRALERVQSDLTKTKEELSSVRIRAVEAQLDATIPEWRRVVSDPQFGAWLDGWDPVSRSPRRDALVRATMAGDAAWVADILGAYTAAQSPARTAPAPAAGQTSAPSPAAAPKPTPPTPVASGGYPPAPRAQIAVQPAQDNAVTRQTLKQLVTAVARSGNLDAFEQQFEAVRNALLNGRYTE